MAITSALTREFETIPLEAGDRFAVRATKGDGGARLQVPRSLLAPEVSPRWIEDDSGRAIKNFSPDDLPEIAVEGSLARQVLGDDVESIWLEYVSAHRYRLSVMRRESTTAAGEGVHIGSSRGGTDRSAGETSGWTTDAGDIALLRQPARGVDPAAFQVGLQAIRLATQPGFDQLISLPMIRDMEVLEHQTRTATTVLRRMRGRALLCDEVGLGKTVEAGLILSELLTRGLARSVLILTPPSLMAQWQGEMRRKFGLELTTHDDPAFREAGASAWQSVDRVIVSTHTAKREPHRSAILKRKWDIVIVDEAHHLRNRATESWKFASELDKQFILLLTATPVQNNLEELFNLVTLLEPGLLSTRKDFNRRFVSKGDKLTPTNVDDLHALLGEVMVRNRRNNVGLQFTRRFARTETVALDSEERSLYDAVAEMVRQGLGGRQKAGEKREEKGDEKIKKKASELNRMTLLTLQMALGSSTAAAVAMLQNLADKPILPAGRRENLRCLLAAAERHRAARHGGHGGGAKSMRLLRLLDEFPDKLVVFTQFRATQDTLRNTLADAGHDVAMFHGGLTRMEKEAAIDHFRASARILLCTESGSEGRNLQFAHGLCNFDLPWNPMRIEQRVGRLSRIGQTHDVHVFNLVAGHTIESAVLHLLEAKLNMFELVIGEVDMILGNLDDEKEFEDVIADEWAASTGADEFAARMEVLGNRLLAAKAAYFRQRTQDEKIFGSRFAPEG